MTRTPIQLSSMLLLAVLVAVGGGLAILSAVDGERARTAQGIAPAPGEVAPRSAAGKRGAPRARDLASGAGQRPSARAPIASGTGAAQSLAAGEVLTLAGTLIELDGGAPVAGARVAAGGLEIAIETLSGANGEFELLVPADNIPPLVVQCAGYAPVQRPPAEPGVALVIALQREGRIAGVIEGAARDVAQGAPVLLFRMNQGPAGRLPVAETAVDANGTFGFGELDTGEYQVCVAIEGFAFDYAPGVDVRRGELREVSLRPSAGGVVRGRVRYRDSGEPVVGATVRAEPDVQGLVQVVRERAELSTQTGADGHYELRGLAPGEATLCVETEWGGRVRGVVLIEEAGQEVERDITLKGTASLAGRVVGSDGQAAAGAQVKLSWAGRRSITEPLQDGALELDPSQAQGLVATTDSEGRYSFSKLPAGRSLHLFALRPARRKQQKSERSSVRSVTLNPAEERADHNFKLQPLTDIVGVVTRRGGQRIAQARLEVDFALLKKGAPPAHAMVESGENGRFRIDGLLPGSYVLSGTADGFRGNSMHFGVNPHEPDRAPLKLLLTRAGSLQGVVVDERGNAVPHATVIASVTIKTNQRHSYPARADEFGRFDVQNLPRGRYRLSASAHNYASAAGAQLFAETDSPAPLRLELVPNSGDEPCTVVGRLVASDGGDLKGLEISRLRSGVLRRDGDHFELQGVRPGRVPLNFIAPGYLKLKRKDLILVPGIHTDIGLVEFHPAGELEVYVRDASGNGSPGVRPILTLVRHGGYGPPTQRVKIFGRLGLHRWGGKGEEQTMRALYSDQVPFGTWRLDIQLATHEPWSRELVFDAQNRKQVLEIDLEPDKNPERTARKKAKMEAKKQGQKTGKKK